MNTEVLRGLRIRYASLFDQPHRLKLELPRKLPSLHDPPPVPSKHLTRCLRNRVQASSVPLNARNRRVAFTPGFTGKMELLLYEAGADTDRRLNVIKSSEGKVRD